MEYQDIINFLEWMIDKSPHYSSPAQYLRNYVSSDWRGAEEGGYIIQMQGPFFHDGMLFTDWYMVTPEGEELYYNEIALKALGRI
jgi:hypothetical protein